MELGEIKMYLKIDGNEEDTLLSMFKEVAEEYLLNAGIETDYNSKAYKLLVLMLISHWYTNRSLSSESGKGQLEIPFGARSLIQQLQYTPQED